VTNHGRRFKIRPPNISQNYKCNSSLRFARLPIVKCGEDASGLPRRHPQEKVAGAVVGGAEQGANGGFTLGFGGQVSDVGHSLASILGQP
jgi:hypothetical protein